MNIWKYFKMASDVANLKEDQRSFHIGAVGIRNDGIIVASSNGRVELEQGNHRGYYAAAHAEARLCRKLDRGSVVFVVRAAKIDGSYKNSKPCKTCQNAMRKRGVEKVYYSITQNEYGVIIFKK